MVGSSVGYLLEKLQDDGVKWGHWNHLYLTNCWCQMGSLELFVSDLWPVLPEGVC